MNLSTVGTYLVKKFPSQVRFLAAHKSEILTGLGIVAGVTSTAMACRASYKMYEVVQDTKYTLDLVDQAQAAVDNKEVSADRYTPEDVKSDKFKIMAVAVGKTGKLYGPALLLGAVSIGCIIGGHNVLRKENAALAAALTGATEAFRRYRDRIKKAYGEEVEAKLYVGGEEVIINGTDDEGKDIHELINVVKAEDVSPYARYFNQDNKNFSHRPDDNLFFLRQQQNWANEKLKANGYLFLNDVYDMLGFPRSKAGCVVGWVDNCGDDFVDFGIYQGNNETAQKFVNGYADSVLLDFNVCGAIDDIFNQKRFSQKMLDENS